MPFYSFRDPDFFDAITPEQFRWSMEIGPAAGFPMRTGSVMLGTDPTAPQVTLLELPPGGVLPRHTHHCYRCEVVVRGSMDVGGGRVVETGDVMTTEPGVYYGPHTAGPEGVLTVEVFSAGDAPIQFEDPDLQARFDALAAELMPKGAAS